MSLQDFIDELMAERFGPIVRDAERVPHLPLWLYDEGWRDNDDRAVDDQAAIEAFERSRALQSVRDGRRRRERRQLRVIEEEGVA